MAAKAQQTKMMPPVVEHKPMKTVNLKRIMAMIEVITHA
jgi:hypothetical protein